MDNIAHLIKRLFPQEWFPVLDEVGRLAEHFDRRVVVVGGVVRDLLLGRAVKEADIMLEDPLEPIVEPLKKKFHAELISHERFKTFALILPSGVKFDFITAREEKYPAPAALPVINPSNIENDFKRRDFTINTMAAWITKNRFGQLLDPFMGQSDLEKKVIRVLHPLSFQDDPTRLYRAARFAARLGFSIETTTADLIKRSIQEKSPALLSPVRRRHEFELVLKENNPLAVLQQLESWSALEFIHENCFLKPEHKSLGRFMEGAGEELLLSRLLQWFSPFGKDRAEKYMRELSFEREIKRNVLDRIPSR